VPLGIKQRGIPEVPLDLTSHEELRRFLVDVRQTVVDLRGPKSPPTPPSNLKATAMAFAVLLQWTRGQNSDCTEILWNDKPTLNGAKVIDQGSSVQYVDYIGAAGVTRYYWARSCQDVAGVTGLEVGPVSATTLAAGAQVPFPTPPPPAQKIGIDPTTGHPVGIYPNRNRLGP
jgi:hypothetical protein